MLFQYECHYPSQNGTFRFGIFDAFYRESHCKGLIVSSVVGHGRTCAVGILHGAIASVGSVENVGRHRSIMVLIHYPPHIHCLAHPRDRWINLVAVLSVVADFEDPAEECRLLVRCHIAADISTADEYPAMIPDIVLDFPL